LLDYHWKGYLKPVITQCFQILIILPIFYRKQMLAAQLSQNYWTTFLSIS